MAAIPVFKIGLLAVKQVAKPIANILKQSAHTNPSSLSPLPLKHACKRPYIDKESLAPVIFSTIYPFSCFTFFRKFLKLSSASFLAPNIEPCTFI